MNDTIKELQPSPQTSTEMDWDRVCPLKLKMLTGDLNGASAFAFGQSVMCQEKCPGPVRIDLNFLGIRVPYIKVDGCPSAQVQK